MILFDITGFVPRWTCGHWTEVHGWAHIVSDVLIFASYLGIPISIIYVVSKKKDVYFPNISWLFAAFIFSCGVGHLIEAIIFWHPVYRLSGFVKVITAIVSVLTLIALIRILPKLIQLPSLVETNKELAFLNRELNTKQQDIIRANQYKNIFLANMSHDLKTPLNSIIVLSDLLLKNKKNDIDRYSLESIEVINKSGRDLLELISDILELVKLEAGKIVINKEIFSVNKLMRELENKAKLYLGDKKLDIAVKVAEDAPAYIFSDYSKIKQVMCNFISNAIKFTDAGGIVVIGIEMHNNAILLFVKDTGVGLDEKGVEKCFDSFEKGMSENISGTGIGLAISKKIANLISCSVRVESEVNVGSKFILTLPCEAIVKAGADEQSVNYDVLGDKDFVNGTIEVSKIKGLDEKKVLIFNPDVLNAFSMSSTLSAAGMLPDIIVDEHNIVEREFKNNYSLIILDIDALAGRELSFIKQVSKVCQNTPIILLSSREIDEETNKYCCKVINKPVNLIKLFKIIESLNLDGRT